ncbi:hypothetical protein ACP4OV_026305 [Aristida adscensionis]
MSSHGDEPESRGRTRDHGVSKDPGTSKRRRLSGEAAERPPAKQQYLYLVVDDWERGYSVHRVGEADFDSDSDADAGDGLGLGARPVVRIEAPLERQPSSSFAAHGAKIMAMEPPDASPGVPVFDTDTLSIKVCPYPPTLGGHRTTPLYVSAAGKLLSFVGSFVDVLGPEGWSWTSVEEPAPFVSDLVSGCAVHPDGRTVFVSVDRWRPDVRGYVRDGRKTRRSTFAFDMERLEWAHAGEWLLPFKGQGWYDRELDAWVGFRVHDGGTGRVCCCEVPEPPAAAGRCEAAAPAWKLGRDVFFDEDDYDGAHGGTTLVYMGDSRFCMVELLAPHRSRRDRLLRMTSFRLKYDKDGDLRTTATHRRAYASLSYQAAHRGVVPWVPNPVAFWM